MLVKNIIIQEFYNGKELKLSEIVSKINDRVLNEKGNIENYLTGILCRINHSEQDQKLNRVQKHQKLQVHQVFFVD